MTTKVDLLVGKTLIAFMEADHLPLEQHIEAFERVVNNLKRRVENRHMAAEQKKAHSNTATDQNK